MCPAVLASTLLAASKKTAKQRGRERERDTADWSRKREEGKEKKKNTPPIKNKRLSGFPAGLEVFFLFFFFLLFFFSSQFGLVPFACVGLLSL